MLTPFRQDTNSLYLTAQLNELGVSVAFKTIVGDNLEDLTGAARVALERADIVIFSGGLGPTRTTARARRWLRRSAWDCGAMRRL